MPKEYKEYTVSFAFEAQEHNTSIKVTATTKALAIIAASIIYNYRTGAYDLTKAIETNVS